MGKLSRFGFALALALALVGAGTAQASQFQIPACPQNANGQAHAPEIMPAQAFGPACTFSATIDGRSVLTGQFQIGPNGDVIFAGPQSGRDDVTGASLAVNGLSGNADPILGFAVAGNNPTAAGLAFGFTFSLPIAIDGPIAADSSVSYSLTSTTAAGAQVTSIFANVVTAFEVDSSVGGLGSLNKGVDVGNTFGFVGGPQVQNSPIYTATNSFTGNLAYDLMVVNVNFALSANSNVGMSGFVQQVPVPEPASLLLLGTGILGLARFARRRNRH